MPLPFILHVHLLSGQGLVHGTCSVQIVNVSNNMFFLQGY